MINKVHALEGGLIEIIENMPEDGGGVFTGDANDEGFSYRRFLKDRTRFYENGATPGSGSPRGNGV